MQVVPRDSGRSIAAASACRLAAARLASAGWHALAKFATANPTWRTCSREPGHGAQHCSQRPPSHEIKTLPQVGQIPAGAIESERASSDLPISYRPAGLTPSIFPEKPSVCRWPAAVTASGLREASPTQYAAMSKMSGPMNWRPRCHPRNAMRSGPIACFVSQLFAAYTFSNCQAAGGCGPKPPTSGAARTRFFPNLDSQVPQPCMKS